MQAILFAAAATAALIPAPALCSAIDVLWLSGSPAYNANVVELARTAPTYDPDGDGALSWNLTLWNYSADPTPTFSDYDVLVVGSTYGIDQSYAYGAGGTTGFFGNGVFATGILAHGEAIARARGSRTFLTGQDPDWHDYNNRPDQLDGPVGFAVNAVNWAGSGEGLGIVSFSDRYHLGPFADVGWWTAPGSFLADELGGSVFALQSDSVYLGAGQQDFPVNEGLTSAGLSGWRTSAHAAFGDVEGYVPVNFNLPDSGGLGVTIVTAGQESGATSGKSPSPVPLPAPAALLVGAMLCIAAVSRRSRRPLSRG